MSPILFVVVVVVLLCAWRRRRFERRDKEKKAWLKKFEHQLHVFSELLNSWPRDIAKDDIISDYEQRNNGSGHPLILEQSIAGAIRRVPIAQRTFPLRSWTDGGGVLTPRELRYRTRAATKLRSHVEDWCRDYPPPASIE